MISYVGRNPTTLNFLKTLYLDSPAWTPVVVSLMPATWMKYREDLEALVLAHPRIFPGYQKGGRDFDFIPNPSTNWAYIPIVGAWFGRILNVGWTAFRCITRWLIGRPLTIMYRPIPGGMPSLARAIGTRLRTPMPLPRHGVTWPRVDYYPTVFSTCCSSTSVVLRT